MFVNLHGYSTFSFLESIGRPKDIIKTAKSLGQTAIALTDQNVVYGAIQHYQAGNEEGVKPIIGVEIGFIRSISPNQNEKNIGSLCLLALNETGYLNLLKLVSYAMQDGIAGKPKISFDILKQHKEGLVGFSGGAESWIIKMLNNGEPIEKVSELHTQLKQLLGPDKRYLEIIAQDHDQHPEVAKNNSSILQLAQEQNTPCIVSNIYAYPKPEDKRIQELAMAIKDNLKLYDPQHRVIPTQHHIMSEEEIRRICIKNGYSSDLIQSWIHNTTIIAEQCETSLKMGQALFPKYEAEEDILQLYEKYKDNLIQHQD